MLSLMFLHGPGTAAIRKEIQARYDDITLATSRKDSKMLTAIVSPDFSGDTPEGTKIDRAQAVGAFIGLASASKDGKWSRKVVSVTMKGQEVLAVVDGHFSGHMPGKDGKLHMTELTSRVEDTWVHPPKWQVSRSHMVKMSLKMDGKVMMKRG